MLTDANKVIKQIIGRDIEFYDYTKLDKNGWGTYFNDAQYIIKNETFNNELKHYITDLIKFITYEANDFDQVLHTRSIIVGLETFKDRLDSIENPNIKKKEVDEFESL